MFQLLLLSNKDASLGVLVPIISVLAIGDTRIHAIEP